MTIQVKIKIISPLGIFVSKLADLESTEVEGINKLLEGIQDLNYIAIDTEDGKVYVPGDVVKQSVVICEIQEDADDPSPAL